MIFKLEGTENEINSIINKLNHDSHEAIIESKEQFNPDDINDVISVTNDFSTNLKLLRKSNNLTQEQLGIELDIPFRTIMNWERAVREPTAYNLLILARFFNIDPFYLYGINLLDTQEQHQDYEIDINNTFAENLKILRKNMHLTQKELAALLGVSFNTIIGYENARRIPDYEITKKFAQILDIDPFILVGKGKK